MFVTGDAGILKYGEAVHPEKVVTALPELFRDRAGERRV